MGIYLETGRERERERERERGRERERERQRERERDGTYELRKQPCSKLGLIPTSKRRVHPARDTAGRAKS